MEHCAGIIPFRVNSDGLLEFFVGTPYADCHYWALLKGHIEEGESPADAAIREFEEESGLQLKDCGSFLLLPLGHERQNSFKTISAYGLYWPDILPEQCRSNLTPEGKPEIVAYRWMTYEQLAPVTTQQHLVFYQRLTEMTKINTQINFPTTQTNA
jgi:8-oxo-dGTP pyrophosphatase MutT (NUDIX family)